MRDEVSALITGVSSLTCSRLAGTQSDLYPSKNASALLNVGVGIPRVIAVVTTFLQESYNQSINTTRINRTGKKVGRTNKLHESKFNVLKK